MPRLDGSYPHIRRQAVPPVQDNQDEDNFFEDLETLADGSNPRVGSYSQSIFLERNVTYILEMTGNGTSKSLRQTQKLFYPLFSLGWCVPDLRMD